MPPRVDPDRVTPTHIKCGRCLQWKRRNEYSPQRYTCKECRREQCRALYRSYSPERLDALLKKHVDQKRSRRKRDTDARTHEIRAGVKALLAKGYSYYRIGKICGVCNKTVRMIDEGGRAYHKRETIDRIYEGLFVAINAPLGGKQ
jgi:hypothetical protein